MTSPNYKQKLAAMKKRAEYAEEKGIEMAKIVSLLQSKNYALRSRAECAEECNRAMLAVAERFSVNMREALRTAGGVK